jgi:hypothetical protein
VSHCGGKQQQETIYVSTYFTMREPCPLARWEMLTDPYESNLISSAQQHCWSYAIIVHSLCFVSLTGIHGVLSRSMVQ